MGRHLSLRKTHENDPIRLRHMLEWARIINRVAAGETRRSFVGNQIMQLAMARSLQIIGEAATNVTAESRRGFVTIPWADIIGMRNRLVHVYYAIDMDVIWKTVTDYIPPLIADLESVLEQDDRLLND